MSLSFLKSYGMSVALIGAMILGSLAGVFLHDKAAIIKPVGDIFLNLLFTTVVPLVFFSLSSTLAQMTDLKKLARTMFFMMIVFTLTGIVASVFMLVVVYLFSPSTGISITPQNPLAVDQMQNQWVSMFAVNDFNLILSKKNMLALIVFSSLVGISAAMVKEKAKVFIDFLIAGNEVMSKVIHNLMYLAPIGLGAYFAYLVGVFGPDLLGSYSRVVIIYYPAALIYFFIAFSIYVAYAGGLRLIMDFWRTIIPVALTAWATGSSIASITMNMEAAKTLGVPRDIRQIIIPFGATIHMEGSCLSAILKISLLFGIYGLSFWTTSNVLTAICIAILSGTVMSGIPGGGFLGEMLIVMLYGFPTEALPIISMVGTLVDPPATMVNSVGDNVSSMIVSKWIYGPKWREIST